MLYLKDLLYPKICGETRDWKAVCAQDQTHYRDLWGDFLLFTVAQAMHNKKNLLIRDLKLDLSVMHIWCKFLIQNRAFQLDSKSEISKCFGYMQREIQSNYLQITF